MKHSCIRDGTLPLMTYFQCLVNIKSASAYEDFYMTAAMNGVGNVQNMQLESMQVQGLMKAKQTVSICL